MLLNIRASVPLVGLCLSLFSATALAQDPGSAGLRWEHTPTEEAFIPGELTFGLHDNHVWATGNFGSRRFLLFDSVGESGDPRAEHVLSESTLGSMSVVAAHEGTALFAMEQHPAEIGAGQTTQLKRYDVADAGSQAGFEPTWTTQLFLPGSFTTRIATDARGETLAAAIWNDTNVALALYDGVTGEMRASTGFFEMQPHALELSEDGERIVLSAGQDLWILDGELNVRFHRLFDSAPSSVALSGDGQSLAVGFVGRVELYRSSPQWSLRDTLPAQLLWVAAQIDLDHTGNTLALGWWNAGNGVDLRFELRSGEQLELRYSHEQFGTPGGLQNLPSAALVTSDGSRAAFGCWGRLDSRPELLLVDREQGTERLSLDLPGSVRGLALDRTGTRVAVAFKETHANAVGFRGSIQLHDTGERDLQLRSVPSVENGLQLWHRPPAARHTTYLALGSRAPIPSLLSGGSLFSIDSNASRIRRLPSSSAAFRAEHRLPLHPFLRGQTLSAQTLFRTSRGWRASRSVLDFTVH